MKVFSIFLLVLLGACGAKTCAAADSPSGPSRAEVEAMMGLPSEGDRLRGQLDTIGFVVH